ncbi:YncE family protein [Clostridium sp. JNZ X4-2]
MLKYKPYKILLALSLLAVFLIVVFITVGYRTKSLAKEAQDPRSYYFVVIGKKTICKIDTVTNQIVSKINVEGTPEDMKTSSDGKTLVVVVSNIKDEDNNGFVLFYNIKDNKLIKKLEIGKHPSRIAFVPNKNYIMITNAKSNDISLIDAENYTVLQPIPVGRRPKGVCMSADGRYCYVANTGEDTITAVDMNNFKSIKKIRVGRYPVDISLNKDSGNIMVTLSREKAIALINPHTEDIEKIDLADEPKNIYR